MMWRTAKSVTSWSRVSSVLLGLAFLSLALLISVIARERTRASGLAIALWFFFVLVFDLMLLDGGTVRTNLSFAVLPTQRATKLADILTAIEANLPPEGASGAVVYCATRDTTERVAGHLKAQGLAADHFHAGLPPDRKAEVQEAFRTGQLRVIAATNAFGMGIDKPDIRLVVHGDIPGSLENYLQEAGRAGRDRAPATCVLLFSPEDVERQFSLSARRAFRHHACYGLCTLKYRKTFSTHQITCSATLQINKLHSKTQIRLV